MEHPENIGDMVFDNPEIVRDFFANPIINTYLARPTVIFSPDKHPDLIDSVSKRDHEHTDHYELKVYRYLPDKIPYRTADIQTEMFYRSGAPLHRLQVMKLRFSEDLAFFRMLSKGIELPPDVSIAFGEKRYIIDNRDKVFKLNLKPVRFCIASWLDGIHQVTYLQVRSLGTGRSMFGVVVDSASEPSILGGGGPNDIFLKLQTDTGVDNNCFLYSYNYLKACVRLLAQPEIADRIYTLAEQCAENEACEAELYHIFREEIKAYLPEYYESTGDPKSPEQIRNFHLQQRWEIGRQSLLLLHDEQQTAPMSRSTPS